MTTDTAAISAPAPRVRRARPWRAIVFAPEGDGQTRRRGSDAVRIVLAVLAVLCAWLVVSAGPHPEEALVNVVTPPPSGVKWLVNLVWILGSLGVVIGLVGLSLLARRWRLARDLASAAVAAELLSLLLQWLTGSSGGRPPDPALDGIYLGFPVARTAVAVAVAWAALPYLSRALQRLVLILVVVAAVAVVVHGSGMPVNVLASVALGWGVAAALHLILGSPLGLPSAEEVAVLLSELGVGADRIAPAARQEWGVARFTGRDDRGRLDVSVYGRDAHDAQLLAKVFRFVFYRDSGPTLALTRVQQVEHEAYLTLAAERSGARVPSVVAAGSTGPSHDAVLVTRPPAGSRLSDLRPLDEGPTDAGAADLLAQVDRLQVARIAHGAINEDTVVIGEHGASGLVDFRAAVAAAPAERLDRDLAGALATLALAIGPERAVAAASVLSAGDLVRALPYIQRAALDPVAARSLRGQKAMLADLRQRAAKRAGIEVPKLVEPRRLSWVNLVMVVGTLIGGWALIGVLLDVSQSFSTIRGAEWGWVVATFIFSQLAYPAEALTVVNSIVDPIPFGRTVALEVSNSFVALAGGSMAVLAARVRFFQQEGYDATLAVSSGVLISTVSWIVKGALFLIALPIAISNFHFQDDPTGSGSHGHLVQLIVLAVVAVGVVLGLVFAVPRFRRLAAAKLRPKVSEMWSHLKILARRPRNLVAILIGSITAQLVIALALGTALHAFNQHLSLAELLIVLTLASMLGGVSPVPGGMGIVEAGMILGLTAAGIPQTDAVAATFVQRLFTSYLPPIWGWFILVWMRRKEYL